ncbi:MAG TPA: AzlC family ABC transporter permease [Spirochaetia bacterium]|nr:AzlC family ABC transporter permease [Spirochaetia bacterium]
MWKNALRVTVPVMLGYITIGIAFGLLLRLANYPWYLAPIMSIFVYAGALQYLAVGLLAANVSIAEAALLALVVNARHIVYGLSLLEKYRTTRLRKFYLIYTLTDETYALITSVKTPQGVEPVRFYTAVSFLDQCYWVIGSLVGAVAGGFIPFDFKGLDFALTALFVVLLVEQLKGSPSRMPFFIAAACSVVAFFVAGPQDMLIVAMGLTVAMLLLFRNRMAHDVAS